jgi:cell division protein FtsI (penicillin-binding protein 3)
MGMGARDAVFLLEKRGVKVTLVGRGKVSSQSLPAGHKIKKGETCVLRMS